MEEQKNAPQQTAPQESTPQPASPEPQVDSQDADKNKPFAIIGYIIPILFFIPLVSEEGKKSAFAKFHANQQLNLLLFAVVGWVAATLLIVVIIGVFLLPLVWIATLVFAILGIINAANGRMKKLPLLGGFSILK